MTEWIDVRERLPKDCESVLIIVRGHGITTAYMTCDKDNNPFIFTIVDFDEFEQYISLKDVTHWMPLPEMPE